MVDIISKDKISEKSKWNDNTPLTSRGGLFDRGEELRQIAAYFSNGKFYVSKSHINNPKVLSLLAEIRMSGRGEPDIEVVDITRVQTCYTESGSSIETRGRQDDARMLREVLPLVGVMA